MSSSGIFQLGVKKTMSKIEQKEGIKISGIVTIKTYKAGTKELLRILRFKNLVVSNTNRGRNLIAQRLGGTNTYTLNITHGEIGTGSTAPSVGNTGLVAAVARVATTLATVSNNILTLQFFFSDVALPNGIYNEFGTFVDGAAGLGIGQLFNRALFGIAYTKNAGEDTTVETEFTIN